MILNGSFFVTDVENGLNGEMRIQCKNFSVNPKTAVAFLDRLVAMAAVVAAGESEKGQGKP